MKKQLLIVAMIAFLGIFLSYDAGAQGWHRGHGNGRGHREYRAERAYRHGYYQGARHAYRYDRHVRYGRRYPYYAYRHPHYYHPRPYYYRGHRHGYYRPGVRGHVTINIPLPPHP